MEHSEPLDEGVSKICLQATGRNRQSPDRCRHPPTGHLHRQGAKVEEQRDRAWRWKVDLVQAYQDWLPMLNTRVDLTLKSGIGLQGPKPTKSALTKSRVTVLSASGTTVATRFGPPEGEIEYQSPIGFGTPVTEDLIGRDVVRFLMRLNSYVLKPSRGLKYKPRLSSLVVLEYGGMGGRPHLHALIERPAFINERDFALVVRKAWLAQPSAHREMRIEPVRDLHASLAYNTKSDDAWSRVIYDWREPDVTAWWRG